MITGATTRVVAVIASCGFSFAATAAAGDADVTKLTSKYGCQVCHSVDKKLVGPTYQEVARKYAGEKTAPEKLRHKVKTGGSGVWGAIPMPPTSTASDADIAAMVEWILSLSNKGTTS